ncbi:hypothetical protein [Flavobacterium sp. JAS]|uniref:hypothetical protein n=1 Tax=Flavobacterium sp. JAS TaxID=2897329 RepID=UPI001E4AC5A8|nr:hypothetical protein [Flavobacterium sp. JAS]MCD0468730.1 hypothetical protein [Flavobacterium sp. JAS]
MKYIILLLCVLFFTCSEKSKKQPIEFNEKVIDFAIENCNDQFIELPNLYDSLPRGIVPEEEDEKLILAQILKRKGFEITNWGRGNHPLGPRIVVFNFKKDHCKCEVQKIYYSTDALPLEIYKITERIKCKKQPKTN